LGLIGALVSTRMLKSFLFGVTSMDPFVFAISAVILLAVALVSCFIPGRRAAKADPAASLRF
jgi:putative ABC transport system permease protein